MVPRWRALRTTLDQRELGPLTSPTVTLRDLTWGFNHQVRDWEQNRTFSFAADLLACAIVLGRESEVVDAAEFILERGPSSLTTVASLARGALGLHEQPRAETPSAQLATREEIGRSIHEVRLQLETQQRNALLWVELARCFEALAHPEKAKRAIGAALELAPTNRYVLRCASRLFLHQNDYRRAHDILCTNPVVRHDPWILAAEIAVASAAGRSSKLIKTARKMLEGKAFAPLHVSELASALSTLELEADSGRRGRKLFRQSLVDASENAIAQGAWLVRRYGGMELPEVLLREGGSSEALAWSHFYAGEWKDALDGATRWQADQFFSARPAWLSSFIASVCLEDYETAENLASRGLLANPNDFLLLNNHAFALAKANKIKDAWHSFSRINARLLSSSDRVVWLATQGLLCYRSGNGDKGRTHYLEAIRLAQEQGNRRREAFALAFLAMEELRLDVASASGYLDEALERMRNTQHPELKPVECQLRRFKET